MCRHMKKHFSMSYHTLQAKVVQTNQYLLSLPDGTEADHFTEQELLVVLEYYGSLFFFLSLFLPSFLYKIFGNYYIGHSPSRANVRSRSLHSTLKTYQVSTIKTCASVCLLTIDYILSPVIRTGVENLLKLMADFWLFRKHASR